MAGEPQPWPEGPCAVRDTRTKTVVPEAALHKTIPANVIGGPDNAVVPELPCRGPTNTEPGADRGPRAGSPRGVVVATGT